MVQYAHCLKECLMDKKKNTTPNPVPVCISNAELKKKVEEAKKKKEQ